MADDEDVDDTVDGQQPSTPARPSWDAPLPRAADMWRRLIGTTPADMIGLGNINYAAAIAFARAADADDGDDGWTPIGPRNVGGAVRAFAQDTAPNSSTFWAGSAGGGLWKSVDDGNTWVPNGEADFGVVPIGAIAVADPAHHDVVWVGTGEPLATDTPGVGLWRTENGGGAWARLALPGTANNGDADHYTRIAIDPQEHHRAWVACNRGLWRFDPGGAVVQEIAPAAVVDDVAIAVNPANNGQLLILAGINGLGVARGVWTRATNTTVWAPAVVRTAANAAPPVFGRVKVAFAPSNANTAYAMLANASPAVGGPAMPQRLYRSTNAGQNFRQQAGSQAWPGDSVPGQAFYSMCLAVHPTQPNVVVAGHVDLYVSRDGGRRWQVVTPGNQGGFIHWENFSTFARRAEHGDMHAIHFDLRDLALAQPRVWVGNDGGVSMTSNWVAPGITLLPTVPAPPGPVPPGGINFNWRKRSYGILGGQTVDVTSHPVFPSLTGVGMQDNAAYVSYGGPTWYLVGQGDGAAMVWDPGNARRIHISWQFAPAIARIGQGGPVFTTRQALAEVATPNNNLVVGQTNDLVVVNPPIGGGVTGTGVFRTLIAGDGVTANRLVVAAQNNAYLSTAGTSGSFNRLLPAGNAFTPDPLGNTPEVGALAFVPGSLSNRDIYVGSSTGDIFSPTAAGPWRRSNPFAAAAAGINPWVTSIAVHPANRNIVAACAYRAAQPLMLSHDGGQNWRNASGGAKPLPPAPIACLAWHPTDEKILYAGTMVGVFVARDLPAFAAGVIPAPNPTWKTFNRGLGPILVNDLEVVPILSTLRAATYNRGVYEASLRGQGNAYATPVGFRVPAVRLSIRNHALDDSRTYAAPNQVVTVVGDPRLPAGPPAPPAGHLAGDRSIDIKVNAPEQRDRTAYLQSEVFGNAPDGAELDETFVSEQAMSGDVNVVYVQVHNRGWRNAENVQVYLYYADAGAGAGVAPPLDGLNFPNDPPAANPWKRLAPVSVTVQPGNPKVVRFQWTCPVEIPTNAALMAICKHADDDLAAVPAGAALAWVNAERRAALRIVPIIPDRVFIRDGVDDQGQRGAVAWGGRSPDIMVMTKVAGDAITAAQQNDPAGPLSNLNDPRRNDVVRTGANTIFVRVFNRGTAALNVEVKLWQVPLNSITSGAGWTAVGAPVAVNGVPARGWRTARFQLAGAADPAPANPAAWAKAFIFAAGVRVIASAADGSELESLPDPAAVTGVDEFWTLFTRGPKATNAAFKALRFQGP